MGVFNHNGFKSCKLTLLDNDYENVTIYPHEIGISRVDLSAKLTPSSLTISSGSIRTEISSNRIYMSDGSNSYIGFTGTAEYALPNGYSKLFISETEFVIKIIIMKLNFKELHVFNGLSRVTEAVEDVREMFADAIYASGRGVASLELCRKIYNSDGEEEYDEKEVELIKEYSRFGNPRFIDAIDNMIEKQEK